jgi:hypothetical protein
MFENWERFVNRTLQREPPTKGKGEGKGESKRQVKQENGEKQENNRT